MKIVKKETPCRKKSDFKEPQEWWESPYVLYGFNIPRVRSNLEVLMGSYVVRATDLRYMEDLQNKSRAHHADVMQKKIYGREVKEVERTKRLILDGDMPIDEAPKELASHPVIRTNLLAKNILEKQTRVRKKMPKEVRRFNYELLGLQQKTSDKDLDAEDWLCDTLIENKDDTLEKVKNPDLCLEYMNNLEMISEEDCLRIKYENLLVKEVRETETTTELYKLADEII